MCHLWELLLFFNYVTLYIQVYYSSSNLICELTREEKKKDFGIEKKKFSYWKKRRKLVQ